MVEGHEERIDDDAERDEELDEGVVHEEADQLLKLDPAGRTVPDAANVEPLERESDQTLFDLRSLFVIVQGIWQ